MAMKFRCAAFAACLFTLCPVLMASAGESRTLQPFESEEAFRKMIAAWHAQPRKIGGSAAAGIASDAPAFTASDSGDSLDMVMVTGSRIAAGGEESITNVQTEGVDEGDIVKYHGEFMIVLRRGRLFVVRISDDRLEPVSAANAYGEGIDPEGAWYDEMLVSDNTIVVIGYSYEREGTEVGLFDLSDAGVVSYRATYHLRSDDYYSSRNYASRLIGDKLIFYTPLRLWAGEDIDDHMPGLRRWMPAMETDATFSRILPAARIYRRPRDESFEYDSEPVLHTVGICDLSQPQLTCEATAVVGGDGQVFYVSQDSVFVWTASSHWDDLKKSIKARPADVFRIPLDGSAPTGVQVSGMPIDQMSFLQKDDHLNVLVGAEADGQWMWSARSAPGDLSLLRIPLSLFADGRDAAKPEHYRRLGGINWKDAETRNRFIGDWLVVAAGESWSDDRDLPYPAQAIRYASSGGFQKFRIGHPVERIEAMGADAILVGGHDDDLRFTSVSLQGPPRAVSVFVQKGAEQGDDRSHGFFYRARGDDDGLLGLPVLNEDDSGGESASVLFLRNQSLHLRKAGTLAAERPTAVDDDCKASCVDWYGDARPIFIGDRVFALLGYELVEGHFDGRRIRERRRVDFSSGNTAAH